MATTIKLKNGSGAPTAGDLVQGEPALDLTNKRLYTEDAGGNVIEVGTSPSTIDINAGSIDGVTLGTNSAVTSAVITTADINGGTIDGTTIGGSTPAAGTFTTFTSTGIDDNASSTAVTIDSSGNVGIGTSSPNISAGASGSTALTVSASTANDSNRNGLLELRGTRSATGNVVSYVRTFNNSGATPITDIQSIRGASDTTGSLLFRTSNSDAMTIDSSGSLLVGTTTSSSATVGARLYGTDSGFVGAAAFTRDGSHPLALNRLTSDGDIVQFRKNGTTVGSIGTYFDGSSRYFYIAGGSPQECGIGFYANGIYPSTATGSVADNSKDLGSSNARWDDIYATNALIQTSDRNEKQDIEELSEAEQRVAVAAKSLMRKFRWKDAVEEKGDEARIHFGIIAQDLQAAFEAEGLDAGRYAMFISSTWWEHDVEVPAVEAKDAVLDEEGNVIEEAVEAKEAYTRTDTYESAEEAPEGAVERTRLGVRYSELLAFIIAAI